MKRLPARVASYQMDIRSTLQRSQGIVQENRLAEETVPLCEFSASFRENAQWKTIMR